MSREIDQQNDHLDFKFNCPGNDPFETKSKFINQWPLSQSCKFVVGVFGIISSKDYVPFTLKIKS